MQFFAVDQKWKVTRVKIPFFRDKSPGIVEISALSKSHTSTFFIIFLWLPVVSVCEVYSIYWRVNRLAETATKDSWSYRPRNASGQMLSNEKPAIGKFSSFLSIQTNVPHTLREFM